MARHSLANQLSTLDSLEARLPQMFSPPHEDARLTDYRLDVLKSIRATLAFMQEHEQLIRDAVTLDREKRGE